MKKARVRPGKKGLIVRLPITGRPAIPAKGAEVELTAYVTRRLQCGDLVLIENNISKKDEPAPPKKTKKAAANSPAEAASTERGVE